MTQASSAQKVLGDVVSPATHGSTRAWVGRQQPSEAKRPPPVQEAASLCQLLPSRELRYLDLDPQVAQEAEGEHELQDEPWPAMTP